MKKALLTGIAAIVLQVGFAQFLDQETIVSYPQLPNLRSAQVYDLNGDGQEEIIAITSENLIVYQNQGDFVFDADTIYSFAGNTALDLGMADTDLDGTSEFFITLNNLAPRKFTVAGGTLADAGDMDISGGNTSGALHFGIIDGDAYPDLAIRAENEIIIYFNSGSGGTFSAQQTLAISCEDLDLGDLNGNGFDDLCTASEDELLYIENESGLFSPQTFPVFESSYSDGNSGAFNFSSYFKMQNPRVEIRDLDGDGDLDAFHSYVDSTVTYYWDFFDHSNRSVDIFGKQLIVDDPTNFPSTESYTYPISIAESFANYFYIEGPEYTDLYQDDKIPSSSLLTVQDLDDDPDLEHTLLVPGSIYREGFESRKNILDLYGDILFSDVDGSGDVDLILIAENGTSGVFKDFSAFDETTDAMEQFVPLGPDNFRPVSQQIVNLGGLQKQIVSESSKLKNRIRIVDYQDYPDLTEETLVWDRREERVEKLQTGDMNGDGNEDLVFLSYRNFDLLELNYTISYAPSDGVGLSTPTDLFDPIITNTKTEPLFFTKDLDNDADADLVLCDCRSESAWLFSTPIPECALRVFINNGGFSNSPDYIISETGVPKALEIDDFNDDGNLEILVNYQDGTTILYTTELVEISTINSELTFSEVFSEDYNGDGYSDIYFTEPGDDGFAGVFLGSETGDINTTILFTDVQGDYLQFAELLMGSGLELLNQSEIFSITDDEATVYTTWNASTDSLSSLLAGNLSDDVYQDVTAILIDETPSVVYRKNFNGTETEITLGVFEDLDGDGLRSPDEPGIPDISISFENDVADQAGLAFTNGQGEISFDVIAIDSLDLAVNFDSAEWELTTGNSPITVSAVNAPDMIEFGLQSSGSGFVESEDEESGEETTASETNDTGSDFTLTENNAITSNNYVYVDDFHEYTWTFQNTTGETIDSILVETELKSELEWETLSPVSGSHDASTVVSSTQGFVKLEVKNKNVALPDTSENTEAAVLSYTYRIKANENEPHLQLILNQASLIANDQSTFVSNTTETKVYTCMGLEESLNLEMLEACSPGAVGFYVFENEPEADYVISRNGSAVNLDELDLYDVNGDTLTYAMTVYDGTTTAELSATNVFGCSASLEEVVEVDTIPEVAVGSLSETPDCFAETFKLYGISDVPTSFGWLRESQSSGSFEFLEISDTLEVSTSDLYLVYSADIMPECRDTAQRVVELLYPGADVGYIAYVSASETLEFFDGAEGGTYTWFIDGELIPGATTAQITPEVEGWYTCQRDFGDCSFTPEPFFYSPLSTFESEVKDISVYPNPAIKTVYIEWAQADWQNKRVSLIDVSGKIHHALISATGGGILELDVSSLASGLYLLDIRGEDGVSYREKIVVER